MLQCHDKVCPSTTEVFLWNNALNIAIGQCIIAGAVGVWCLILVERGDESVTGTAVERFDGFLDRGSSLQMLRRARTHRSKHQFGMCFVSWMQLQKSD